MVSHRTARKSRMGTGAVPKKLLSLLMTLALVGSVGCMWTDGSAHDFRGAGVGLRPLIHVERTDLDSSLDLDGPGAFEVGFVVLGGEIAQSCWLGYAPLEEKGTGRDVGCYWLDLGGGFTSSSADLPESDRPSLVTHWEVGPSLTFMDFEKNTYDTVGVGGFARLTFDLRLCHRVGAYISGDIHGWLGVDAHGAQSAWATSLGMGLVVRF